MVTSGFYGYHDYQWLPETVYGHQWFLWLSWLSVVISGYLWLPQTVWSPVVFMVIMVISGYQWFSVVTRDCVWSPVVFMVIMVISGYQWVSCGYQRLCMVTSGFYGYHGYQWLPETVYGHQWFLWLSWLSVVTNTPLVVPLSSSLFFRALHPPGTFVWSFHFAYHAH